MALFEVFIPGKEAGMPNVTLTVEAQNWIGALRSGLKSIGEGQEAIANVMCDIKEDNSIHVTDVATRRVFRLREVGKPADAAPAPPPAAAPKTSEGPRAVSMEGLADAGAESGATQKFMKAPPPGFHDDQPRTLVEFPAVGSQVALPSPESSVAWTKMPGPASGPSPLSAPAPVTAASMPIAPPAAPPPAAAPAPMAAKPQPADTSVTERIERAPKGPVTKPVTLPPGGPPTPRGVPAPAPKRPSGQFAQAPEPKSREVTAPNPKTDPRIGRAPAEKPAPGADVQDAIAAVFDATQDLYMEAQLGPQQVADKLLDIALRHIPAESGTFYIADVNGHELQFTSVRGPKADALKKSGVTVKVGQGIIGFCALEGVCLAVSDIQKDPRFFSAIANKIDHQPRDTLCASAEKDGRLWGAVQLINSKGGFEAAHMEVLRFIGLTAAAVLERIDASSPARTGRDA